MIPERRLWQAVLIRAYLDLIALHLLPVGRDRYSLRRIRAARIDERRARAFFFSPTEAQNLQTVCEAADCCVRMVRNGAKNIISILEKEGRAGAVRLAEQLSNGTLRPVLGESLLRRRHNKILPETLARNVRDTAHAINVHGAAG